jgi:hypothetical protein
MSITHINSLNKTLVESFEIYDKIKKNYSKNYENYLIISGDIKKIEDNLSKQNDKLQILEKILDENLNLFYEAEEEYKRNHLNYTNAIKKFKSDIIDSKIKDMNAIINKLKVEKDNL